MSTSNPYQSPLTEASETPIRLLTAGMFIVIISTGIGAAAGCGIGAALGLWLPDYYRSVFPNGAAPGFNPLSVGIGQGLTQGVVFGAVVGLALVAIYYWHLRVMQMKKVS